MKATPNFAVTLRTREPDDERAGRAGAARVTVACSARLHLGFLDLNGDTGRRFGSIGLALDRPVTRLVMCRAAAARISGPEHERVARYLALMRERLGLDAHHDVEMCEAIPSHAGLGSGTQLALAVATAVRRLHGCPADLRGDAERLERGARSGIGVALFRHGGLVIDGGKGRTAAPPPVLARAAMPSAWRVVLVLDRRCEGLSGAGERAAFQSLPLMPAATVGTLCRLVLMQVLPALAERDLAAFGAAISTIQEHVGDHFAPQQGGRFSSPAVAAAMRVLAAAGATGIGQSSWGPTGFAFAANAAEAQRLIRLLHDSNAATGLDLLVCRGLNRGATVNAD